MLPTSPLHQLIPALQPPSRAPRLAVTPPGSSQPHTMLWGVCSTLLSASLHVCKDLQKISNPLQLVCYICSQHLSDFCTQQRGGTGWSWGRKEALHSAHAEGRKSSLSNQMTGPDLAAQQGQLSRHSLICHPLQERTFALNLQTQEHIEDTHHRTFLCESGFALEPPACWARRPRQSQWPRCSAAACTQPVPAVCAAPQTLETWQPQEQSKGVLMQAAARNMYRPDQERC